MGDELCGIYLQYFWERVVTMCLYVIAMTSTLCSYLPLCCSLGDLLPHRRCSCCQLHVMILQHLTAYSHAIVHIASVYMASNTCRGLEGSFCVCVCVSVCMYLSIHAMGYVYDHTCQSTFRYHLFLCRHSEVKVFHIINLINITICGNTFSDWLILIFMI